MTFEKKLQLNYSMLRIIFWIICLTDPLPMFSESTLRVHHLLRVRIVTENVQSRDKNYNKNYFTDDKQLNEWI